MLLLCLFPALTIAVCHSVFFPPATGQLKAPVLYYLSGLSCTDRNAVEKVRIFRALSACMPYKEAKMHRRPFGSLLVHCFSTATQMLLSHMCNWRLLCHSLKYEEECIEQRYTDSLLSVCVQSGLQRKAAELGIAVVCPDTSPRGLTIAGEDDDYDFGSSAGFYLNATQVCLPSCLWS